MRKVTLVFLVLITLILSGCADLIQTRFPISPDFQAWGPTTRQEFALEQPVMLGIMLAEESLSWQSGGYDEKAFMTRHRGRVRCRS